jgi:hypothetical protein
MIYLLIITLINVLVAVVSIIYMKKQDKKIINEIKTIHDNQEKELKYLLARIKNKI